MNDRMDMMEHHCIAAYSKRNSLIIMAYIESATGLKSPREMVDSVMVANKRIIKEHIAGTMKDMLHCWVANLSIPVRFFVSCRCIIWKWMWQEMAARIAYGVRYDPMKWIAWWEKS
mmetsp:Transcript_11999/g.22458  ORF Transcript_11999/g.22458 Transcript_11999/m.22458 type:complete len:116 (+) Transcript_11999:454-801(+)